MQQPNIVFIFMDDMGWRDLGCSGSTFYETPNIDQMCREGMRFDCAYAACPVCSPSRASFLSGQYPARIGVTDWIDESGTFHPLRGKLIDAPYLKHMPENTITVAERLKNAGYQTWHVGKWHLGGGNYLPENFGFDLNIGGCEWGHPSYGYFSPYHIPTLEDGPEGEYLTDRLTDEAIELIRKAPDDKPFFLNFCHYAVHNPIQAKPEDILKFQEKASRMRLDRTEALIEGEHFHTINKKDQCVKRRIVQSDPNYAAMIWNLDWNIGRLRNALEQEGHGRDTIVIFTSDNGGLSTSEGSPTCNFPAAEGKGWMYEGGTLVPAWVWWPGHVAAGRSCAVPINTPDFYPTLLDVAGLAPEEGQVCDGISILPLLQGKEIPERPVFWHYPHYGNQGGTPGGSVRLGKYKLIEFYEDGKTVLFNLEQDISESRDVSEEEPEIASRLKKMLHDWRQSTGAVMPQRNADYEKEWNPVEA